MDPFLLIVLGFALVGGAAVGRLARRKNRGGIRWGIFFAAAVTTMMIMAVAIPSIGNPAKRSWMGFVGLLSILSILGSLVALACLPFLCSSCRECITRREYLQGSCPRCDPNLDPGSSVSAAAAIPAKRVD